jgi:hypothetical protein
MENKKIGFLAIVAQLAIAVPAFAQMQYAGTINYEYKEKIDQIKNFGPLDDNLFGDSTNFENGETTFSVTDIDAKTNVKIPIRMGRSTKYTSGSASSVRPNPSGDIFGLRWDADVPYIEGDHLVRDGWVAHPVPWPTSGGRCSNGLFDTGGTNVSEVVVPAHNWFFGNDIKIPGRGRERLLAILPGAINPTDGASYVGTTRSGWRVSCLATIKNDPGEGFLVLLPDGSKYYFDWIASSNTGFIATERGQLDIAEFRLYATKAVDRFGGYVEYTYDASHPHRITQIKSSDNVIISILYNQDNGKVDSVSSGGKTWRYTYASQSENRDYDALVEAILPDGSRWTYDKPITLYSMSAYDSLTCAFTGSIPSNQPPPFDFYNFRITHPSGAIGEFKFNQTTFGYNRTPGGCATHSSYRPAAYIHSALYSKSISGPGVSPRTWIIKYYPSWSYESECNGCATTETTVVTDGVGRTTSYVFGNDYSTNAGQLLSKTISNLGISSSKQYQYLTSAQGQPFPDAVGVDTLQLLNNPFLLKNRPVKTIKIIQDGWSFTSQVEAYDQFIRPTRVTNSNAPLP